MPAGAYTNSDFFDLEVEKVFRKEWLPVGHVAQIPNVGDYFTIDVLNELLVVVRGRDRIRVMSRVCLHRWAPVCEGSGNAKVFSCPFHRWSYGLDGQLIATPLMEAKGGFNPRSCSLPEIRSEVVCGTIFITFSDVARSAGELLADWTEAMEIYRPEELKIAYSVEFDLNFNWKIAVETFMESYHHIGAHATTAEPYYPAKLHWVDDTREGWTAGHGYLREDLPTSVAFGEFGGKLDPFPSLSEDQLRRSLVHLVYPIHCFFIGVNRLHWTALIPVAVNKTRWVRHVLVQPEALERQDFPEIVERLRQSGVKITEEDMAVNDMQQKGAASSFAKPGFLHPLEKPTWQLSDYVRRRLGS
ncbi:aromatic ring-hydroxylating oxygenase subunit alpha [Novosphingobium album (ex Liu et al. 2023)]|uniref:Aromatic ring-hydroxylating dioxygenase subunit alpha n=1 Tax=Novosphingobium album (ex Liu et al. 2023) TaxID=3031130 RepID=A0ABT5WXM4_9SPHN|nr:aromatic ring-hydroxylating dioxygenase subunit alpha [Novosphingobium album (ex Liu et al. 2023)]MDE8654606.1 aromatic ring-hydroxylating dioxygenase subunit alpha [Novosphingobium album (ex Liu et al. 2023)]